MRTLVIGAGAMGSLVGGFLADHFSVHLDDVWKEHLEVIERDGLIISSGEQQRTVRPQIVDRIEDVGPVDLVMLWVKSFDTEAALERMAPALDATTIVCSLQNGLGNVELIERHVVASNIVYGVTGLGAVTIGPGHIQATEGAWTGTATTWIGDRDGASGDPVQRVAAALSLAGMRTEVRPDIDVLVWNKLAMASSMACLTAITRMDAGRVLDTPETNDLLRSITREIVFVARAKGLDLDADDAIARNFAVYETVRGHWPSMLQDVVAKRQTEVDFLCGSVVREARNAGVEAPLCEMAWQLVRSIESNYDAQVRSHDQ